jgi:hypothetical protein
MDVLLIAARSLVGCAPSISMAPADRHVAIAVKVSL